MEAAKPTLVTKENLFKKFYNMTADIAKKLKEPLVERSIKRKFESAADFCLDQLIEAENEFNKLVENIEDLDVNKLLKIEKKKEDAAKTKETIEKLYFEFFGTKLAT